MTNNKDFTDTLNTFKDAYHDSYLPEAVHDLKHSFSNFLSEAAQYLENVSEDLQKKSEREVNNSMRKVASLTRDEKLDTYHKKDSINTSDFISGLEKKLTEQFEHLFEKDEK